MISRYTEVAISLFCRLFKQLLARASAKQLQGLSNSGGHCLSLYLEEKAA